MKKVSCLKQGIKMYGFCLKQGIKMSGCCLKQGIKMSGCCLKQGLTKLTLIPMINSNSRFKKLFLI